MNARAFHPIFFFTILKRGLRLFLLSLYCCTLIAITTEPVLAQAYFHFTGNQKKKSVPYKFYRNLIVVTVMLNGQGPFNFVLDTGVGVSTITDPRLKDLLNLQRGKKVVIHGLGEKEGIDAFLTSGIRMTMNGVESLPLTMVVFEEDPFFLSTYLGVKVHGILGYEFFSSFTVKINYSTKLLTLYSNGVFRPSKSFVVAPIELRSNKPFIKAFVTMEDSPAVDVELLLDTGAGFPLSLESYSDKRLKIPARHFETQLGLGLNGIIHGSLARTSVLTLAAFDFHGVITSFPDYDDWETKTEPVKRNGSIGNFLLKRFVAVFDYTKGAMYLKPVSQFDAPFEYDRTGIELIGGGEEYNHYIVYQVKRNSPAAEVDIRPDDELVEVNFQPVKNLDLGQIDHILSNPNARSVMLKLRRGDDYLYVLLKMRDLI